MKNRIRLVAAYLVCCASVVVAQDVPPRETVRERLLKQFDKDGDGKLSPSERAALREAIAKAGQRDSGKAPEHMTWKVGDLERESLVYLPTKKTESGAPVVFGFHGHGGNSRNSARTFAVQQLWPEAMVVYMQGVPTPGRLTDPDGKRNGWQHDAGEQGDRDFEFFDAVLKTLREKHEIDESRIYATGHSNGGGFTYLLWSHRPDIFAAIAPSAAGSRSLRTTKPKPIPVMHIAGEKDALVKFAWQERTMDRVRAINACDSEAKDWDKNCKVYLATNEGAPFVSFIHGGTHKYPKEAPALIVKFFQEHKRNVVEASK